MKRNDIELTFYLILAIMCALFCTTVSDVLLRGTYSICTIGMSTLFGMSLQKLINKDE